MTHTGDASLLKKSQQAQQAVYMSCSHLLLTMYDVAAVRVHSSVQALCSVLTLHVTAVTKHAHCCSYCRMAPANLGRYSDNFATAASTYQSHSYYDDLAWGACWLYRATNDSAYLTVRGLAT